MQYSNFNCPSCGTTITDLKSPYCPKCLQIINRNVLENKDTDSAISSGKIMRFEGSNGQIELFKDKVIIKRAGFWAAVTQGLTKGDKTIYLNQITGIQLKLGGLVSGYIQFTLPGGIESKKGVLWAQDDENSVMFSASANDSAIKLKEKIEELKYKSTQNTSQTIQVSNADEIKKFKQLFDEGIITKDEFDKKKKELLGL